MSLKFPFPGLAASVIAAVILCAAPAAEAKGSKKKPAAKPAPAKSAAKSKAAPKGKRGREEAAARGKASKRETRAADSRRDARGSRASKNDRQSRREERASKNERRNEARRMSKRERLAEARREAERRRREAAERARQLAIIQARIRAFNQALREETVQNIMKDETTGEDMEVRSVAVRALGEKAGTVVVMNPKTGQVYTVVNQEWGLRRGFKPCSTIKLVTGLAGLNEKVIDPVQTVNIGTGSFSLDLTDSLALSNNGYFQRVGGEVGFDKMMSYAREMGLGQPTGINHRFESPGKLPVFKEGFGVNRMSSHGDDIEVTAVQLANMASAIGNGGKLLVPHLPRTPEENVRFKREVKRDLAIPQDHLRRVIPGMVGAVTYGTARRSAAPAMTVAGKTGSCIEQSASRPWVGLFTSYAPVHDPQLAVAVILRGTNARGKWAAAVAGEIYRNLGHRFGPRPGQSPALLANDFAAPARPKVDARLAAEASDEEKEGEEAEKVEAGRQEQDAYVVSEAGSEGQSNAQPAAPSLQRTVKSAPRPAPQPEQKNTPGAERPRRVSDRP